MYIPAQLALSTIFLGAGMTKFSRGAFKMLHIYWFIFLIVFALAGVNCDNSDSRVNRLVASTPDVSGPVLEIFTSAYGSVYPREGEILQLRLYRDGHYEYDDYPDPDPPHNTQGDVKIVRRAEIMTIGQVQSLLELCKASDFLRASETYPSFVKHTDTAWITRVTCSVEGRSTSIEAKNVWDTQYVKSIVPNYPSSLIELLELSERLKEEITGRKSHWLARNQG